MKTFAINVGLSLVAIAIISRVSFLSNIAYSV